MDLLMVLPKVAVAGQDQSLCRTERFGLRSKQTGNSILLEVFLTAEDRRRPILAKLVHHQRSVPGRCTSEKIWMPQQQAPGTPTRLTKAEKQSALRSGW